MSSAKISIRFFDDREVRAIWDEENAKWRFSVLDIVAVLTDQNDYVKTRNYWKYLKAKLKNENSEVVSATTQLKLLAPDGKKRLADVLDYNGIIALGKQFPGKKAKQRLMRYLKVLLSKVLRLALLKDYNKYMPIYLVVCTNLLDK
jgi:cell filamentation protein